MKSSWTKGLKGPAKEDREKQLLSFGTAFRELNKLLDDLEPSPEVTDYSDGWQFRQAHRNGEIAMQTRIRELLETSK